MMEANLFLYTFKESKQVELSFSMRNKQHSVFFSLGVSTRTLEGRNFKLEPDDEAHGCTTGKYTDKIPVERMETAKEVHIGEK